MEQNTIAELRKFCKDNHYKGYSKFTKKKDLLEFIKNSQLTDMNRAIRESQEENRKQQEYIRQQENEIKAKQNSEYEKALQEDLKRQEMEDYKKKRDVLYSQPISINDLEDIRAARLARFG